MRPVIVLGAGVYQLPLIARLQHQGHHVIAVSRDGDYPGFKTADEVFLCDIVDSGRILEFCKQRQIAMIATTGSDVGLPAIGLVNDSLGLPGIGYEAACWAASKQKMKTQFARHGVRSAQQRALADYMPGAGQFRPFVAKRDVSSGSAGVFIIETPDDFAAFGLQGEDNLVLEDFIPGVEFGAQVVITDRVERIYLHGDDTFMGSAPVPVGHTTYFDNLAFDAADLITQVQTSQTALGLRDCVANYDFILHEAGCFVLEVGARLGATGLAEMIEHAHGVDLYQTVIDLAQGNRAAVRQRLGDGPLLARPERHVEAYLLFADQQGQSLQPEVATCLQARPEVIAYEIDYPAGTALPALRKGSDRFGLVLAQAGEGPIFSTSQQILSAVREHL